MLLLSLATVALFTLPPRYDAVGPQLLQNADLAQGLAGWETHGDATVTGGVALLQNRPGAATAALYQQPRIADAPLLRLTMEVRVADIQPGPVNWQVPRLLLVTYDRRDRPRWQVRHMAPVPGRTDRFKTFSVVAQVPHDNPHILFGAQLAAGSGRMWVRRLSLQPMKADTAFLWMRDSLLAVWLPALAWAAWPLLSAVRSRRASSRR